MRTVFIIRSGTLLVFAEEGTPNFDSSVQINIYGSRAVLHTVNGKAFYEMLSTDAWAPFKKLGLDTLYASVTNAHLRLMKRSLKGVINVIEHGKNRIGDLVLNWVEITEAVPG